MAKTSDLAEVHSLAAKAQAKPANGQERHSSRSSIHENGLLQKTLKKI